MTRLDPVVQADLEAAGLRRWTLLDALRRPEVRFVIRLRAAERARASKGPLRAIGYALQRLRYQRLCDRWGMTVPLGVFGPGLSIAHVGTLIVNRDARVGARCRLHPGVTIGATAGRAPIIGDDVFFAPGSGAFGAVRVGDRVHLGPNAVVTEDVADGALVVAPRSVVLDGYADRQGRSFTRDRE